MDIVLVRHGARSKRHDGGRMSDHGRHQVQSLARALKLRGTLPDLLLTSRSEHAQEAAELLAQRLAPGVCPVALDALTPFRPKGPPRHNLAEVVVTHLRRLVRRKRRSAGASNAERVNVGGIDEVVRQAQTAGADLQFSSCLLVVGHEGRLSDLVTELTGARSRPLSHGGAVCVRGASLQDLAAGRGSIHHRYPTVDHQEEPLRAKVNSKMTVATFLAGFVFTALSAVLLLDKTEWPWHRVIAATTLTASLALFVASVYIYDQLGTPSGFWTDADRPRAFWRRLYEHREARLEDRWAHLKADAKGEEEDRALQADEDPSIYRALHDGPVYWLMVRTSRFVFTPAVVLALAGFVALLVGTGDWRIWTGGIAGLLVAGAYASLHRPNLGAD